VSRNLWKRAKQQQLFTELQEFWSEDIWDMRNSPVKAGLTPVARQRYLYFECKSQTINNELKYACWKKFSEGGWRTTATSTLVHRLIKWLNTLNSPPPSFMSQSFESWRAGYTSYLKNCGMYNQGTTKRVDAQQRQRVSPRDSAYIGTLRQVFFILEKAYDDRPEQEKDVWDLRRMAIPVSLSLSDTTLNFSSIRQLWLRKAAKAYLQYCLSIYADGTCRTRLQSITCFSEFLSQERPRATPKTITRRLLLKYLSYLPNRLNVATRKGSVINLRTFLEIAAREHWLPLRSERMIYDEEVPQPPKPQPRYIPSAVLDQLNKHLGTMKAPWMQMVLVLQECGMRLSELLGLPLDCLTQDARGTFFLRFMQGKMKREHKIPLSQEIARVIQEQQQIVRCSQLSSTILFPNPRGKVFKQSTFTQRINHLAYKHEIRDANGKLFRFQSHQFRHTVGTRMINLGVPHHFIQRYLGHLGPEMTSRYAHIHDATMKEKLSEYLQGTLVDVMGKTVPESGPLDTGDLQWFTRNVLAQALTNGYCAIPTVAGPCPHPNACLNCAHFRTDITFLDVHRSELRETERVIAKADANGWARQSEMNQRKQQNLVKIITALEAAHA
jgi:integrase/recombinase XerD